MNSDQPVVTPPLRAFLLAVDKFATEMSPKGDINFGLVCYDGVGYSKDERTAKQIPLGKWESIDELIDRARMEIQRAFPNTAYNLAVENCITRFVGGEEPTKWFLPMLDLKTPLPPGRWEQEFKTEFLNSRYTVFQTDSSFHIYGKTFMREGIYREWLTRWCHHEHVDGTWVAMSHLLSRRGKLALRFNVGSHRFYPGEQWDIYERACVGLRKLMGEPTFGGQREQLEAILSDVNALGSVVVRG